MICFLATIVFSGAVALNAIFDIGGFFEARFGLPQEKAEFWAMIVGIWTIGIIAASYTIYGGLRAVVWSDLIQTFADPNTGRQLLVGSCF